MPTYSSKQIDVLRNAHRRWNILSGAVRSGKSFVSLDLLVLRLASMPNGNRLLLGKTERTLQRNILDPLRARYGAGAVSRVHDPGVVDIFGKPFYIAGANDDRSVAKIQGLGLIYAYGDEITTWAESMFQMLKSRLDKPGAMFDGTCNPEGPYHWLKKDILDNDQLDMYHQHFELDDNPYLTDTFKANLKMEYTGVWYQRYIKGLWVLAEGTIYDMFNRQHIIERVLAKPLHFLTCDYGTANPCVFLHAEDDGHNVHIADEYYHDSRKAMRQKTDEQYADDLAAFVERCGISFLSGVYVDPSAKSFIVLLKQRGYNVLKPDNTVDDGIRTVGTLLNTERLTISAKCQNTIEEFASYVWDTNAQNRGEDKPMKDHDHAMDALRYICHTRHKQNQGGIVKVRM